MSLSAETPEPASPATAAIPEDRLRLLFALLFSSQEAVTMERMRQVLYPSQAPAEGEEQEAVQESAQAEAPAEEVASPREHLEALEAWMEERNLPLVLHQVGRSYRLLTTEDYADDLQAARKASSAERVGPAALEVLALVAYRQPLLKADIDAIRGVKSGGHLRHLLDLRLVRILGRAELPGRPFLYGTTRTFLDRFGLRDLSELPEAGRLASSAEPGVSLSPPAAEPADSATPSESENSVTPAAEPEVSGTSANE